MSRQAGRDDPWSIAFDWSQKRRGPGHAVAGFGPQGWCLVEAIERHEAKEKSSRPGIGTGTRLAKGFARGSRQGRGIRVSGPRWRSSCRDQKDMGVDNQGGESEGGTNSRFAAFLCQRFGVERPQL